MDIRVDLVRCAGMFASILESVFAEPRNWFLHVEAPSMSRPVWIDMLRIVTSGNTDFMQFDTNHDGVSDGIKVNFGLDALGYDADQDGIPNAIDPDDTVPSWAPALQVSSSDYTKSMGLSFYDLLVPLSAVSVQARFNATDQTKDLSSTYGGGTTWSVNPNQHGQFPDGLVVQWRDVYGTRGTVTYWMGPEDTAVFVPKAIVAETLDAASQETVSMAVSLAGAAQRQTIAFGSATPYADSQARINDQGELMSIIGTPLVAKGSQGFLAAAGNAVAGTVTSLGKWFMKTVTTTAQRVADQVDNVANGFRFAVKYTRQFSGVTPSQLNHLMQQGKAYPDDGGNILLFDYIGESIIVGTTKVIGDGVVVLIDIRYGPAIRTALGTWDQASGMWDRDGGYGHMCGPKQFADYEDNPANPIDELDTSCFIHDWCVPNNKYSRERPGMIPFTRHAATKACNGALVANASDSDCERTVGSEIRIDIPDPIGQSQYRLPVGATQDSHGRWHNPTIDVQEMTPGPFSPCRANRDVIMELFALGIGVANAPLVLA